MSHFSQILSAAQAGDPAASSQLLPLVYDELRKLAAARLDQEAPGQTLQPTALVHEAYVRLAGAADSTHWENRGHFFAAAALEPRAAEVVKLRYFAGLTLAEAAAALDISPRTADADWAYARAWLVAALRD